MGRPKDVEGQCNARLYLADDFGDNPMTFRCNLPPGHEGTHEESFPHDGQPKPVKAIWHLDERTLPENEHRLDDNDSDDLDEEEE